MGAIADLLLVAKLAWDGKEAEEGMGNASKSAETMESRMGKTLKKVGTALAAAFTVDKIIDFGKQCIASGAEVSAETAAFSQIMGDYAGEATKKMGDVAKSAGMVDTRLTPYMTSMTAKFKGLGYGVDDATSMAARGLTLATDASAFWDKSLDESMGHLNSFINGSYEGGEAIGLFANDTQMAAYAVEKGIVKETKAWANLDEATKQATRLEYAENMMKQSGATGQAAKESGAYANVMANLAEKWRQFQATIGEPLIENVVIPAVNLLSEGIDALGTAVEYVKTHFSEWKAAAMDLVPYLQAAVTVYAGFKAGTAIQSIVTGFQNAKLAVTLFTMSQGSAGIVTGITTGALKLQEIAVGLLTGKIKLSQVATALWSKAQAALNAVLNANPIGLVITAIVALVAGFVLAYNKSETFRNFVNGLWESLKKLWGSIKEGAAALGAKLAPAWSNMKNAASTAWSGIKNAVGTGISVAKGLLAAGSAAMRGDWSGAWSAIKGALSTAWSGIKTHVKTGVDFIGNLMGFPNLSSKVASVFETVKTSITQKIESARDKVKGIVDKIVGFFTGAKFSWPSIPMPHFSITPDGWKIGDLLKGSIPKLGISWYANAMDEAAVLDGATIFGAANGQLLGGGEAGREVVSGEEHLIGLINQAVAQNNAAMLAVLREILEAIRGASEELYDTIVEALTDGVRFKLNDREFGRLVRTHA